MEFRGSGNWVVSLIGVVANKFISLKPIDKKQTWKSSERVLINQSIVGQWQHKASVIVVNIGTNDDLLPGDTKPMTFNHQQTCQQHVQMKS